MEQVATPSVRGVVEVHVEPVQSMLPAGVPPGPVTLAVKTKVPPVDDRAGVVRDRGRRGGQPRG